jgi:predicted O-methyltransferase YrrM
MLPARYLFFQAVNTVKKEGVWEAVSRGETKMRRFLFDTVYSAPGIWKRSLKQSREQLTCRMEQETELDDILDTAYDFSGDGLYRTIRPVLGRSEVKQVCERIPQEDVNTVVEIGTARGGSLYIWARYFEPDKIISIDVNHSRKQIALFNHFTPKETTFIRASSYSPTTVNRVKDILDGDDIDLLFIDGDHRYEGVKKDFEYYSPMVRPGGRICFDDISETPRTGIEVAKFWREVKAKYNTEEFYRIENPDMAAGLGLVNWPGE